MGKAKTGVRSSRNAVLSNGIRKHGAAWTASKSRRYLHAKKGSKGKQTAPSTSKVQVLPLNKPRWYAADDVPTPLRSNKSKTTVTKLRSSITPGTVLIVLAGRFRGRRVVFLKQLPSGLLLVTGPYQVNGVPLRRLNQRYVIATSSKVEVSKVDVTKIDDAFFAKAAQPSQAKEFFDKKEEQKKELSAERVAAQKAVDSVLLGEVKAKGAEFVAYLGARFSLTKNTKPHQIKF